MRFLLLFLAGYFCMTQLNAQRSWGSYETTIGGPNYHVNIECQDTTIQDTVWTTINRAVYDTYTDSVFYSGFRGYITHVEGKVFYWNPYSNERRILYDYRMQIGDTILLFPSISIGRGHRLTAVDSIEINGVMRKRMTLTTMMYDEKDIWVEGVGSILNDYFESGEPQDIHDAGIKFICFRENLGWDIWFNSTSGYRCLLDSNFVSCDGVSAANELERDTNIGLFPNPTNGQFHIASASQIDRVEIYDINGQLSDIIYVASKSATLSISNLSPAIYLVRVISSRGTKVFQLLVE